MIPQGLHKQNSQNTRRYGVKLIATLLFFIFSAGLSCSSLYYNFEPLQPPVNLVAIKETSPVSYTRLQFNAYNTAYDFSGYAIYTGATQNAALTATTYVLCAFDSNNAVFDRSTLIQHGGNSTVVDGYDCSLENIPLIDEFNAGDWVAVRALGTRECANYPADSGCSSTSEAAVTQVLSSVDPPQAATVTQPTGKSYYLLSITLPAALPGGFSGLGVFSGATKDEAVEKAGVSTSSADFFCTFGAVSGGDVLTIQLGGTAQAGIDCHASTMSLVSGEHLSSRVAVTRNPGEYPWSQEVYVIVP